MFALPRRLTTVMISKGGREMTVPKDKNIRIFRKALVIKKKKITLFFGKFQVDTKVDEIV